MKKCKTKTKRLKLLIIVTIIFLLILSYFRFFVNPHIVNANISTIKSNAISVMNQATSKTITSNDYDNLISISKDNNGNVTLLEVNSKNVNILNNQIIAEVQNALDSGQMLECKLPLGTFLGLPILSGLGPKVSLNIFQIGNIKTTYRSQIANLSINQSYHKIYLTVSVDVCVFLPLYTQNITISNQILIGENIIVGKIPNTYLNTENLTNALNLIPSN